MKDNIAKIAILRRLDRIGQGNFGDSKFVGESVFELRFDIGEGYRVYFTNKKENIVFLLAGGKKNTQQEDIREAIELAQEGDFTMTTKFDVADYLDTKELQDGYLEAVAKENDPAELIKAIKTVARAKGMSKTANDAGITREGLYKALSPDGNPAFYTVWQILASIGYTLTPTPLAKKV